MFRTCLLVLVRDGAAVAAAFSPLRLHAPPPRQSIGLAARAPTSWGRSATRRRQPPRQEHHGTNPATRRFATSPSPSTEAAAAAAGSTAATSSSSLPDIATMRAGQIKEELESYGIGTKSFLEKSELVSALVDARAKGMTPKEVKANATAAPSSTAPSSATSSSSSSSSTSTTASSSAPGNREQRIADEMDRCRSLSAKELRQELKERGVNTASFLEKSEFVRALAEARVDGKTSGSNNKGGSNNNNNDEEGYAEYKNVEVLTDDASGPRAKQSSASASSQQGGRGGGASAKSPFGGGASPFGGGASPFGGGASPFGGGMGGGGMGGIADILKNMGMGGGPGAAASPFGGMGGNPFGGTGGGMGGGGGMGDMMGKAQELMKNPKVRDIMMKAQSYPRIKAKVNECMSNPASFLKYQNDPEVSELINELKKYM